MQQALKNIQIVPNCDNAKQPSVEEYEYNKQKIPHLLTIHVLHQFWHHKHSFINMDAPGIVSYSRQIQDNENTVHLKLLKGNSCIFAASSPSRSSWSKVVLWKLVSVILPLWVHPGCTTDCASTLVKYHLHWLPPSQQFCVSFVIIWFEFATLTLCLSPTVRQSYLHYLFVGVKMITLCTCH